MQNHNNIPTRNCSRYFPLRSFPLIRPLTFIQPSCSPSAGRRGAGVPSRGHISTVPWSRTQFLRKSGNYLNSQQHDMVWGGWPDCPEKQKGVMLTASRPEIRTGPMEHREMKRPDGSARTTVPRFLDAGCDSVRLSTGIRANPEHRQPWSGSTVGVCSPLKKSGCSSRCWPALGTRPSRLAPMSSAQATSSSSGPAAIPIGRPHSSWSARFAKMAESAVRFCARIAAGFGRLGTRTGCLKSPKSGACPSLSLGSPSGQRAISRSARVVIIWSASRSGARLEKPGKWSNKGSSHPIRYRQPIPIPGIRPDNEHYAALCRSP